MSLYDFNANTQRAQERMTEVRTGVARSRAGNSWSLFRPGRTNRRAALLSWTRPKPAAATRPSGQARRPARTGHPLPRVPAPR